MDHIFKKCQVQERQRLRNSSRLMETKDSEKLNASCDPGLDWTREDFFLLL